MESYEVVQGKKLRQGYTTGSCAAAATKAAARMLLGRVAVPVVQLTTPRGLVLDLEPEDVHVTANAATCAIRKDSGDDQILRMACAFMPQWKRQPVAGSSPPVPVSVRLPKKGWRVLKAARPSTLCRSA